MILSAGFVLPRVFGKKQIQITPKNPPVATVPIEMADYKKEKIGFGFNFPSVYKIEKEELVNKSNERDRRVNELTLILSAPELVGTPQIILNVNTTLATGRADTILTMLQDGKGLFIAERTIDPTLSEGRIVVVGSLVMSDDNVYTWQISFDRGIKDYSSHLEAILSSFGLFETEKIINPL